MDRWQRAATSTVTVARGAANSGAAKLAVAGHSHTACVNTITWAITTKKQSYTTARCAMQLTSRSLPRGQHVGRDIH